MNGEVNLFLFLFVFMKWSSLVKFLLGSMLGIAILLGGGLAISYYFLTRLAQAPPKPTFANDTPTAQPQRPSPQARSNASVAPEASPTATDTPLEPGAYRATVVYPEGLLLRDSPGYGAIQIGGVAFNQQVIVLEESADKDWQRIRLETGEEGWVKAGNVQRVE